MKILIVANMFPSQSDKTYGTFIQQFYEQLKSYNKSYHIKLCVIKGRTTNKYIKVFKYIVFYMHLIYLLIFFKFDYIYIHTITYPIPPILLASKIKHLNLIFNVHGIDVITSSNKSSRLRKLSIPLLKKSLSIVVPSKYFKDIVLSEFPFIDSNKIIISPSGGIDDIFYHQKNKINSTFTIGYISRIDYGKGWDVFIKALYELKKKGILYHAILGGMGKEYSTMLSLIKSLNLTTEIEILGGVPHNNLPIQYNKMDIFVFPSQNKSESLGLVGLEAMASSVPVIGSKINGIASYIKDGINGYLVDPYNHFEICNYLIKYKQLKDSDKLKMSKAAFDTALKYQSTKVSQALFNNIFKP